MSKLQFKSLFVDFGSIELNDSSVTYEVDFDLNPLSSIVDNNLQIDVLHIFKLI